MREIKFRGKIAISSGWAYGHYALVKENGQEYSVIYENGRPLIVRIHTVSQYTGLKDKNGKEIYEGDVVKYLDGEFSFIAKVAWSDWMWYLEGINPKESFMFDDVADNETADIEIIGNRFEHPHLLEESP